jgi:predicted metalloendopeptidase
LDDSTKNKSLEKLDAFVENVGYPDWILDNQQLDNYYNLVNVFQVQDSIL